MSFYDTHHRLFELFGGYLGQGWKEIYRWDGREPDYRAVLRKYKTEETAEGIAAAAAALRDLLERENGAGEMRWLEILTNDLSLGFYPPGVGLAYEKWLTDVLRILEEPPEETRRHFAPERI